MNPAIPAVTNIVDAHQHLWDLSVLELSWQREAPYDRLAHNCLLDDYVVATDGFNVTHTIYVEVDVDPAQHLTEAEFVVDLCRRDGSCLAGVVVGGRPGEAGFEEYLARFRGSPYVKGVREILFDKPPGYSTREAFLRGIRLLGDLGLCFEIEVPSTALSEAARLMDACPDTPFVLDHCGNPNIRSGDISAWKRDVAHIAERSNVVVKVSGLLSWVAPDHWGPADLAPVVDHLFEVFGSERVLFGGDWPVVTLTGTYKQWLEALLEVVSGRKETERRSLFHDNAVRFYDID